MPGLVEAGLSEAAIGLETEVGAAVGLDESGLEQLLGESVSAVGLGESGLTQLLGESVAEVGLDGSVADTASDFSSWAEVGPGTGGTGSVLSTSDAVSLGSFLHISMSGELVPLRPEEAPASLVEDSGPGAGPGPLEAWIGFVRLCTTCTCASTGCWCISPPVLQVCCLEHHGATADD